MRPLTLRHRVAEPLMCRLVRNRSFIDAIAMEGNVSVENCTGVFHSAEARRRLEMGELLVGEWRDDLGEILHDLSRMREGARASQKLWGSIDHLRYALRVRRQATGRLA